MSFRQYYKHYLSDKIRTKKRKKLSILSIDKLNFPQYINEVTNSINLFNSEIEWDDMWNESEAETRLSKNHNLFILLENEKPLGHVWYNKDYLYNAFVSKKRKDGDSAWFIQKTMWILKQNNHLTEVNLYVDSWNSRAKRFWEKIGFIQTKTKEIKNGREHQQATTEG